MSGSGNLNSKDKDKDSISNSLKKFIRLGARILRKGKPVPARYSYSSRTSPSDRKTGGEWDREGVLCTEVPEREELQKQKWGDSVPE